MNRHPKTSPFEFEDLRSAHHCYKLIFQIPNLKRTAVDNSPHAVYRNRGNYRRYVSKLPKIKSSTTKKRKKS